MKTSFTKFFITLIMNLIISVPIYAEVVEQKDLHFPVKTEELLKGNIHYFYKILSPRKLAVQYPEILELDSLSLSQKEKIAFIVTKAVTVVNRPVGFFEEKQMSEEKFLSHTLGTSKVIKSDENKFQVDFRDFSYKMNLFFDADDVSTSPKKVIKAVTAAKKLDVISQSASTIMFTEKTHFTKFTEGGVSVSSFVPVKENKTLIITYQLYAITKKQKSPALKENFVGEIEALKTLIQTYK